MGVLDLCKQNDDFVINGKILHLPQVGGQPTIIKNRTDFPAGVTKRVDKDFTATLDEYTSDPIHIPNADKYELSYDKMGSVLSNTVSAMNTEIVNNGLIAWTPTKKVRIITTSGSKAMPAHLSGTTGTRKSFTAQDFQKAVKEMNKQNLPDGEIYACMTPDMYDQLLSDLITTNYRGYQQVIDATNGSIGKLFGVNILVRSIMPVMDADGNVLPYGAVNEDTSNDVVLIWHKNFVWRAKGSIEFFQKIGDPQWYGDIYSSICRFLSGKAYEDETGVVAIMQIA